MDFEKYTDRARGFIQSAQTMAVLLEHDSVQRAFGVRCDGEGDALQVGERSIRYTRESDPSAIDWARRTDGVFDPTKKPRGFECVQIDHDA